MSELQIVTFADKALTENNYLKKTCDEKGLKLVTLISSPWIQNVIKLKLLADFVKFQDPDPADGGRIWCTNLWRC